MSLAPLWEEIENPAAGPAAGLEGTDEPSKPVSGGNISRPAAGNNLAARAWLDAVRHARPVGVSVVAVAREVAADQCVSNRELSDRTGHTEFTCQRAKRRLVAMGFLRVVRSPGGPGRRNRYVLTVPGGAQ
jgi:hypothetical protein